MTDLLSAPCDDAEQLGPDLDEEDKDDLLVGLGSGGRPSGGS